MTIKETAFEAFALPGGKRMTVHTLHYLSSGGQRRGLQKSDVRKKEKAAAVCGEKKRAAVICNKGEQM